MVNAFPVTSPSGYGRVQGLGAQPWASSLTSCLCLGLGGREVGPPHRAPEETKEMESEVDTQGGLMTGVIFFFNGY